MAIGSQQASRAASVQTEQRQPMAPTHIAPPEPVAALTVRPDAVARAGKEANLRADDQSNDGPIIETQYVRYVTCHGR